ncbi:MAG TPA: endolytic transglycosylase MltG [Acidimicrobiales bacterium]|nr:endolytic transglycosylase MltG [Acidimicrobiales bacterium]
MPDPAAEGPPPAPEAAPPTGPSAPPAGGGGGPGRVRLSRLWRVVAVGVALLVVVVGGVALWVDHQVNPGGRRGPAVVVDVPSGASTTRIADELASAHVISHPFLFRLYVKVLGGGPFEAGEYSLPRHDSYGDVVASMHRGPLVHRLTIPEGFTLDQIAARVGAIPGHTRARFLAAARSGEVRSQYQPAGSTDLEGLLFPDTYQVQPGETDTQILGQMVARFDEVAGQLGVAGAAQSAGVTPYQAVVVASMVEREAKVPADRGLVAQVVYNRLTRGMRLQVDATVLYALGPGHSTLSAADLGVASPYNTYRVTGLPPTPIASPGRAALEAALNAPKGPYLYYVVVEPDGKEAFSTTLAGQEQNIALARSRGLAG